MKKKFLCIPLLCTLVLATPTCVYAEEEVTTTIEEVEVTETEEVVDVVATAKEQATDFYNKWFIPLLSLIGGGTGAGVVLGVFYKFWKKVKEGLDKKTDESTSANEKATVMLNLVIEMFNAEVVKLEGVIGEVKTDFENVIKSYEDEMKEKGETIDRLTASLSAVKEIMCQLVAMNPDLIQEGFAQKLIELCDETILVAKTEGVEVNE